MSNVRLLALVVATLFLSGLAGACKLGALEAPTPTGPLPDDSLYQLDARFVDHTGTESALGVERGRPVLLAMFYATCPDVCPRLIGDVKRVLEQLPENERDQARVVLVSLDPAHDTPEVLSAVIRTRGLDPERSTLMRGSDADTRRLAALLGVKYRDDGKGAIDHSSRLLVLDREGRVVGKREGLGGDVTDVVSQLRAVLAAR